MVIRRHQSPRRSGAVLPLVTVCLIGLLGFCALAVDIGMMAVARTQAQSAADIGALAGARTLNGQSGNNKTASEIEAREAATSNAMLSSAITSAQVTNVKSGVYRYNTTAQRFQADFATTPTATEAWGATQITISTQQPTYFGRVFGINSMTVAAMATAVHRPRDITLILDFSGSMKFSSEFNYPGGASNVVGTLNPDERYPQYGPWSYYADITGNHAMRRVDAWVDGGGETHATNNLTVATTNGPPIVDNFRVGTTDASNAFVYNGDLTGGAFALTNTPVCTPTPDAWTSQYASGYAGDRWPLKAANTTSTAPTNAMYARTVADILGITTVTNSTRNVDWETNGYDSTTITVGASTVTLGFKNGTFKGYSMGPGYYGKTFYVWPPDPRYDASANPATVSTNTGFVPPAPAVATSNLIRDGSDKVIADWRKRFFLYPGANATTKGAPLDDNSRLFTASTTTANTGGVWQNQYSGSTPRYIPNYDAILAWLKSGPQVLPPSLRAGRVLYYNSMPSTIPIDWATGVINTSSASIDQRFWKEYIDFVLGTGRHSRRYDLYGYDTNSSNQAKFGNTKLTAASALTIPAGDTMKPYMRYDDSPIHPRAHMWFGPLSMLGFLSIDSDNLGYNWYAGTTYEAQTWQLKAGIQSALDDIKNNHPNDLAALTFFSSHNGNTTTGPYNSARVAMGKSYDMMKNMLFYPYSLRNNLGDVTQELRPYTTATAGTSNPCGLNPSNYAANIPLADGGTTPSMGMMVAYNQFNWNGGYTGRKGANKIVILETDGVANTPCGGTWSSVTGGGNQWTGISAGTFGSNGDSTSMDRTISLAWLIAQDSTGSKAWPTFPTYFNTASGASPSLPVANAPTKWSTIPNGAAGYSSSRQSANTHVIAFGELFEDSTNSPMKTRGLEFLRNVQIAGGLNVHTTANPIESYKVITGTYTQRIDKLRQAFERIMQGGVQVALIQ